MVPFVYSEFICISERLVFCQTFPLFLQTALLFLCSLFVLIFWGFTRIDCLAGNTERKRVSSWSVFISPCLEYTCILLIVLFVNV